VSERAAPARAAARRASRPSPAVSAAVFAVALATLATELLLIRTFDAILWRPGTAYMVVSVALLAFGSAGVYATLRPWETTERRDRRLGVLAAALAALLVALRPAINAIPFDFGDIFGSPRFQAVAFALLFAVLMAPFFVAGLFFARTFGAYARDIRRLYFWDLLGAGLGSLLVVPLMPAIGPGGTLLALAACLALAAAALDGRRFAWGLGATVALVLALAVGVRHPELWSFRPHAEKRGLRTAYEAGTIAFTRWDPISRIDVVPRVRFPNDPDLRHRVHTIHYDGGSQSSAFQPFDGDLASLRAALDAGRRGVLLRQFFGRPVLVSHWLRRDTGARTLVIGSAGGQEIKAALAYGARHVDAVELVGTVVELGRGPYADTIGGLFQHPRATVVHAEGRSFLRASDARYDVIQMFSNHTSSTVASGSGAMVPVYLLTAEAFEEYFRHLAPDGVLHINHHVYPRIVTSAALAWRRMGLDDFQRHVVIASAPEWDPLPTVLIKRSPWTRAEVDELRGYFAEDPAGDGQRVIVEPYDPEGSALPSAIFRGRFDEELDALVDWRAGPVTDDRPYFGWLRENLRHVEPSRAAYTDPSTANILNWGLRAGWLPMDLIHLMVPAVALSVFALLFLLVPLGFSAVGRIDWPARKVALLYFSCLGAGFIAIELVLMQLFLKLVGYPLHAYATVLFALLLGAGVGSLLSDRLDVRRSGRWWLPFAGVLVIGAVLLAVHEPLTSILLGLPLAGRILATACLVLPLGFFLGMPFPLGILALEPRGPGAVAWGWAMNALLTVGGGLAATVASMFVGFRWTLVAALGVYLLAWALYPRLGPAGGERAPAAR
jgi:hypothetical protein